MLAFRSLSAACQFFHELPHLALGPDRPTRSLPCRSDQRNDSSAVNTSSASPTMTVRLGPASTAPRPSVRDPRCAFRARWAAGLHPPSSLHYVATTRGSFIPDIDPREHTLMIHGLVDQHLTFTMEDLKRACRQSRGCISSSVPETGTTGDKRPCRKRTG